MCLLWLLMMHIYQLHLICIAYRPSILLGSICFCLHLLWLLKSQLLLWPLIPNVTLYLASICFLSFSVSNSQLPLSIVLSALKFPSSDKCSTSELTYWSHSQDKSGLEICYSHELVGNKMVGWLSLWPYLACKTKSYVNLYS